MIDMQKLWDYLDAQARNIPVPKSYENCNVNIFCNDCCKVSILQIFFFLTFYIRLKRVGDKEGSKTFSNF